MDTKLRSRLKKVSADKCHRSVCKNLEKKSLIFEFNVRVWFFFYSSLINSFSLSFTFQPQFFLPLLLFPSPTHTLLLLPSSSSTISFQKGQASHGLKHSMAHQVEVDWVLPCAQRLRRVIQHGERVPRSQLSVRDRSSSHCQEPYK